MKVVVFVIFNVVHPAGPLPVVALLRSNQKDAADVNSTVSEAVNRIMDFIYI